MQIGLSCHATPTRSLELGIKKQLAYTARRSMLEAIWFYHSLYYGRWRFLLLIDLKILFVLRGWASVLRRFGALQGM